ncbi:hypothetical protein ScalyP_jg4889 [Parmales sp. scaly parma]|nr:hypothetical protein ScalyP_jg4889 [Parmales sp. scaly parma]
MFISFLIMALTVTTTTAFSFHPRVHAAHRPTFRRSRLFVDPNYIQGGVIVVAGLLTGIGIPAYIEYAGKKTVSRGGLSEESMTKFSGMMMEDVEQSSVSDLDSLVKNMEKGLAAKGEEVELSEEKKKQMELDADDGW